MIYLRYLNTFWLTVLFHAVEAVKAYYAQFSTYYAFEHCSAHKVTHYAQYIMPIKTTAIMPKFMCKFMTFNN